MRDKLLAVSLVSVGALALAACAYADTGLRPADPISPGVERSTDIYYVVLAVAGAVFLAVTVPLVLFIVRFRSRTRDRSVEGPQIRGNTQLELAWTAVPVLLLVGVAAFVFYKLPGITNIEAAPGRENLRVTVEGRQFYWQYVYENGVIAIDRLRAPVDTLVDLDITAPATDVQHSFWVPPLTAKFDAIPGRTIDTEFRASETGVYEGQCAEFCGIQHAAMEATIEVLPREEFDRWLAAEKRAQEEGRGDLGEITFEGACAKCHGYEAEGLIGPPLVANPLLSDEQAFEQIVRAGRGAMPAVGENWSERQMQALTRYVQRRFGRQGEEDGG